MGAKNFSAPFHSISIFWHHIHSDVVKMGFKSVLKPIMFVRNVNYEKIYQINTYNTFQNTLFFFLTTWGGWENIIKLIEYLSVFYEQQLFIGKL